MHHQPKQNTIWKVGIEGFRFRQEYRIQWLTGDQTGIRRAQAPSKLTARIGRSQK